MKVIYEIYYSDLTEVARFYLCRALKTTPDEEYENSLPLAIIERELKEESNGTK